MRNLLRPRELDVETLEELYVKLDLNKDGYLDINELGDSIAEAYQGHFDDDERLWVKMTDKSWINQEELIFSLQSENIYDIEGIIKFINFEQNPNVSGPNRSLETK